MTRVTPLLLLLLSCLVVAPGAAHAGIETAIAAHSDAIALRARWLEARASERDDQLDVSLERWTQLARALPDEAEPIWRLARIEWRRAERLAPEQKAERLAGFRAAEALARDCLERAPRSAECMFWLAAALGRITTTRGVLESARLAPVVARLLESAIALRPTYEDGPDDTTLGNLYHYSAAFYRLVPDWFWLSWVLGVRGDKERSVDFSRRAVAISPRRLDYQVELGAGLLCLGTQTGRRELIEEGREVLRQSQSLEPFAEVQLDMAYTQLLLDHSERACSYARDGWIEVGEGEVRGAMLGGESRDRDG